MKQGFCFSFSRLFFRFVVIVVLAALAGHCVPEKEVVGGCEIASAEKEKNSWMEVDC